MNWKLQVQEGSVEDVVEVDQLRRRLMQLHEQAKQDPLFATLNAPDGSTLAIGLGRDLSVLSHTAPGGWPAQHVVGEQANKALVSYKFLGHFSEMPARYAVPLAVAVEAAVTFFESGKLSAKLEWEND